MAQLDLARRTPTILVEKDPQSPGRQRDAVGSVEQSQRVDPRTGLGENLEEGAVASTEVAGITPGNVQNLPDLRSGWRLPAASPRGTAGKAIPSADALGDRSKRPVYAIERLLGQQPNQLWPYQGREAKALRGRKRRRSPSTEISTPRRVSSARSSAGPTLHLPPVGVLSEQAGLHRVSVRALTTMRTSRTTVRTQARRLS